MKNEPRYVIIASNEPKPMGETLLDYARPLIQQLPHDHTLEELKAVVIFAAVLWNVQVVEDISGAVRCLSTKMPPRLRVRPAKGLVLIRRMLTRKDQCFGDDHRLALAVDVHRDGSDLRVTAVGAVAELDSLPSTVDGWPCNIGDIRSGRRHLPN